MKLRVAMLVAFAVVATLVASPAKALGQKNYLHRSHGCKIPRWFGHGWSKGYHVCNPGSDTSYYNPWSAHNTTSISREPKDINDTAPDMGWSAPAPNFWYAKSMQPAAPESQLPAQARLRTPNEIWKQKAAPSNKYNSEATLIQRLQRGPRYNMEFFANPDARVEPTPARTILPSRSADSFEWDDR